MLALKDRAAIEVVDALAGASVNGQVAFESRTEPACLLNTLAAVWTLQLILVEVLQEPPATQILIQ